MPDFCTNCGEQIKGQLKACPTCGLSKDKVLDKSSAKVEENKNDKHMAGGYGGNSAGKRSVPNPKDLDTSDPTLKKSFAKLVKGKHNWCAFLLLGAKLQVLGDGTGGLQELKKLLMSNQDGVIFGCFKVTAISRPSDGSTETSRPKFVYYNFIGAGIPEMVKARANPLKRVVQDKLFGAPHMTLDFDGTKMDLETYNSIGFKMMHAEGSHKSSHFDFGGANAECDCAQFTNAGEEEESEEDFD